MKKTLQVGAALTAAAMAFTLTACNNDEPKTNESTPGSSAPAGEKLSGQLQGVGASSMETAQDEWKKNFQQEHKDVTVNYSATGSGSGRKDFASGAAKFGGTDKALDEEEMKAGSTNCAEGTSPINLPVYISPIALIYNIDGVKDLKLNGEVTAKIFRGEIEKWNDPAIAALNPGVQLPDLTITAVHRGDKSGTTQNFTDTLSKVAPNVWTDKPGETWPEGLGGEAGDKTPGVVSAVRGGKGTIGYADASGVDQSMTVAQFSADGKGEFFGPTAEAAAKVVDASKRVEGRGEHDYTLQLDRTAAGYPFVLVSYMVTCQQYQDAEIGKLVGAYTQYVVSEKGQKDSQPMAGNAPLTGELATGVRKAAAEIK